MRVQTTRSPARTTTALALLVVAVLSLGGCAQMDEPGASDDPAESAVDSEQKSKPALSRPGSPTFEASDFMLGATGLGIGFHPTDQASTVEIEARGEIEVCPADVAGRIADPSPGASYGSLWRDGCRRLGSEPLLLPTTTGRQHVGIRILPVARRAFGIAQLRVSWVCADDHVVIDLADTDLEPGPTAPPCPPPSAGTR